MLGGKNDVIISDKKRRESNLSTCKFIRFKDSITIDEDELSSIPDNVDSIVLVNTSLINLLRICVYMKRRDMKGNILLLFEREQIPAPFYLVNDN